MARGFNTTLGIGGTDVVNTTYGDTAVQRTFSIWTWRNGAGGNNAGRLFEKRTVSNSEVLMFNSNANTQYRFNPTSNGTSPQWSVPQPATGIWVHVVVEWDSSVITNLPLIWLNNVAQTVSVAVGGTGTFVPNTDPYNIGNTLGIRVWDGLLAEWAVWNRFLTPQEIALLYSGESPLNFPASLGDYVPLDGVPVISKVRGGMLPNTVGTKPVFQHPKRFVGPTKRVSRIFFDLPPPSTATAAITLGTFTAASTGTVTVQGSAAITLGAVTVASTGGVQVSGTLDKTLDAATVAATGTVAAGGTLAATLGAVTIAAEGVVIPVSLAGLDKELDALTATITGTVLVQGSLSATLADVALAAAGGSALIAPGDEVQVIQAGGIEVTVLTEHNTNVRVVIQSAKQVTVLTEGGIPIKVTI